MNTERPGAIRAFSSCGTTGSEDGLRERRQELETQAPLWKAETPFQHFTLIVEGTVERLGEGFACPKGSAFMAMKVWAISGEEACDMIRAIAEHIGFNVTGRINIYETEPTSPPRENPYGYDINFTPFNSRLDS